MSEVADRIYQECIRTGKRLISEADTGFLFSAYRKVYPNSSLALEEIIEICMTEAAGDSRFEIRGQYRTFLYGGSVSEHPIYMCSISPTEVLS